LAFLPACEFEQGGLHLRRLRLRRLRRLLLLWRRLLRVLCGGVGAAGTSAERRSLWHL